jgi:hypothetical protein
LCDLFLVIIFPNYLRYSFVQVKMYKGKTLYSRMPKKPFLLDCGQHFLLAAHRNYTPLTWKLNGLDPLLLTRATYDTVSSYSIFFKDGRGDFDADFSAADFVLCKNQVPNILLCPCLYRCYNFSRSRTDFQKDSCWRCPRHSLISKKKGHSNAFHIFNSFAQIPSGNSVPFPWCSSRPLKDDLYVDDLDLLEKKFDIGQPIWRPSRNGLPTPDDPLFIPFHQFTKTFAPSDGGGDPLRLFFGSEPEKDHPESRNDEEGNGPIFNTTVSDMLVINLD